MQVLAPILRTECHAEVVRAGGLLNPKDSPACRFNGSYHKISELRAFHRVHVAILHSSQCTFRRFFDIMAKKFLFFATIIAANTAASTCSAAEAQTSTRPLEMRLQRERQARLDAARTWKFNRPNPSRSLTGRESLRWMDARPPENPTQDMRLEIGNLQTSFQQEKSAPQSAFPASWKWSSDRKKEMDFEAPGTSRVAQQWSLGVEAPVEHPFGTARVVANYRENNGGLSTDAKSSAQDDGSAGGVKLIQDVKIGDLTGSADIGLSEAAQKPLGAPTNAVTQWNPPKGHPDSVKNNDSLESNARLRWQLNSNLALTTAHQSRLESEETQAQSGETLSISEQLKRHNNNEVGVEWKWKLTPNLSLSTSHQSALESSEKEVRAGDTDLMEAQSTEEQMKRRATNQVGIEGQWKLGRDVSLTTSHRSSVENVQSQSLNGDNEQSADLLSNRHASEVGLQWKLSDNLSLAANGGLTRVDQEAAPTVNADAVTESADVFDPNARVPQWLRDEERAALEVQHKTGAGSWGLKWSRQWTEQQLNGEENRRADALSLSAERNVFDWLKLRGSWRLSGDDNYLASRFDDSAQREAEAQIKSPIGRLALRFKDRDAQSLAADGSALKNEGAREYGFRYDVGGDGLGMAVEYSVQGERAGENRSSWRVGVTYR